MIILNNAVSYFNFLYKIILKILLLEKNKK